jgi:hypothetical protein
MTSGLSSEAVALLTFLMPGFAAAWVFYGLTSHPKPAQFERIIQALILTFIVQALVPCVRWLLVIVGQVWTVGAWSDATHTFVAVLLALLLGVALAYVVNKDSAHKWLRSKGFTARTSHPSEWYSVLSQKPTFVILQLLDGRRLYGWPKEWPIERDRGQFYIQLPSWIDDEGQDIPLPQLDGVLIDVKDVSWVELMYQPEEVKNDDQTKGVEPAATTTGEGTLQRQSTTDIPEASPATESSSR